MEANYFISKETGLLLRSVQKMKSERLQDYNLTLTGVMAKKIGLNVDTLVMLYEKGINYDSIADLIETAVHFKASLASLGIEDDRMQKIEKVTIVENYLQEELDAYRVNDKRILVDADIMREKTDNFRLLSNMVINVYINGKTNIDFIYTGKFVDPEINISEIAQYFIADIKRKGFKIERTSTAKEKVEVLREWKVTNGEMEYIKAGQLIDGHFFGERECFDKKKGVYTKAILKDVEFEIDMEVRDNKYLRKMASMIDDKKKREYIYSLIDELDIFYEEHKKDIEEGADLIKLENGIRVEASGSRFDIEDKIFECFGFNNNILVSLELLFSGREMFRYDAIKTKFFPSKKALKVLDENNIGRDTITVKIAKKEK